MYHHAVTELTSMHAMAVNFYSAIDEAILNEHKRTTKYRVIEPTWKEVYILRDADEGKSLASELQTEIICSGNEDGGLAMIEAVSFSIGYISGGQRGNQLDLTAPYVYTGATVTFLKDVVVEPDPPELVEVYQTARRIKAVEEDMCQCGMMGNGSGKKRRKDDVDVFFSTNKRRKWDDWPIELKNGLTMQQTEANDEIIKTFLTLDGPLVYKPAGPDLKNMNMFGSIAPSDITYVTNRNSATHNPKDQATVFLQRLTKNSKLYIVTLRRGAQGAGDKWTTIVESTTPSLSPAETLHTLKQIDANHEVSQDVRDICARYASKLVTTINRIMTEKTEDADFQAIVNPKLIQQLEEKSATAFHMEVPEHKANPAWPESNNEWTWCVVDIFKCVDPSISSTGESKDEAEEEEEDEEEEEEGDDDISTGSEATEDAGLYKFLVTTMDAATKEDTEEITRLAEMATELQPGPRPGFISYCMNEELMDDEYLEQHTNTHSLMWKVLHGLRKLLTVPRSHRKSKVFLRYIAIYMIFKTQNVSPDVTDLIALYAASALTNLIQDQASQTAKLIKMVANGNVMYQFGNPIFAFAILLGLLQRHSRTDLRSSRTGKVQKLNKYTALWLPVISRRYRLPNFTFPTPDDQLLRHAMINEKLKAMIQVKKDMIAARDDNTLDEQTMNYKAVANVSTYMLKRDLPTYANEQMWDLMKARDFDQGTEFERIRLTTAADPPRWDKNGMKRAFLEVVGCIIGTRDTDNREVVSLDDTPANPGEKLVILRDLDTDDLDVRGAFQLEQYEDLSEPEAGSGAETDKDL